MMVMLLVTALASFVVLAARVVADPSNHRHSHPHSLSIAKHIHPNGKNHPVQRDRRRIKHLINKANRTSSTNSLAVEDSELPLTDIGPSYVAIIGVGVPPTSYCLNVDTGSSNTWIGANASYVKTNTSVNTNDSVSVEYGSGSFSGDLYNDTVTIAGVTASQQPIGVAVTSKGIHCDGILGIGPTDLTNGTLNHEYAKIIPTVTDSLFAQGKIKQNLVAVSFEPATFHPEPVVNGELTFGATDHTKYIGDINYSPITKTPGARNYWGIDASIRYGGGNGRTSVSLTDTTAGFVDTGTTLLYLSKSAFEQYAHATGGVLDNSTQLLLITKAQYKKLQSLYFVIGGKTYEFTRNAQIWPRTLNSAIRGDKDSIYLAVQHFGDHPYPGVDFVLGMTFLERFYSVFDSGKRRVGLARTHFTNATSN